MADLSEIEGFTPESHLQLVEGGFDSIYVRGLCC